jgi:two-component system nitrate/nitrite sensor histidine kinase NarQ
VHLLQIVREAVLNAIKHAQASEITVSCVTAGRYAQRQHSRQRHRDWRGQRAAGTLRPEHYARTRATARRMLHFSQPQNGGTLVSVTFRRPRR